MNTSATDQKETVSGLRLRYTPLSPFARKVLVVARETNTLSRIDLVPADVWTDPAGIVDDNPLVKVPALRTPYGLLLNSTVICDFLDQLDRAPTLIPIEPEHRWPVMSAHTLADGVMEAAVTHVMERIRRPNEFVWNGWLERQFSKIQQGLDGLSRLCPDDSTRVDLFTITLACTLEYLDMRFPDFDWRAAQPKLAAWLAEFGRRESMTATQPKLP